ncbi:plasmid mobilization protein [Ethanoligenens sp.]|uniref:plasmid mobilization protein n=1 Tax=Ethanoligenens sp. TaxID=2099655 RepID=UPI0039EC2E54
MLKRCHKITFRLNENEVKEFRLHVVKSGLSQESYIRSLIAGYVPKELPPLEYHALLRELNAIGNNLNRLAAQANSTKHIDKTTFQYEANRLRREVQNIQEAFTAPERMNIEWPPPPSGK